MPYLDLHSTPLTAQTAAHLLRRTTFGPTPDDITAFTGLTASQAVTLLMGNGNYALAPVDVNDAKPTVGQPVATIPWDGDRNSELGYFVAYWWLGVMLGQNQPATLLDKLTLFWQNHFVTSRTEVDDYRFIWKYLKLLRDNALGNYRTLLIEVTKDPAMLKYLNGNENEAGSPNENYGRELQELFTVGLRDLAGTTNFTEDDVRAASRVLTGWKFTNLWQPGSTTVGMVFDAIKHDTTDKVFSAKYGTQIITGRSGPTAGDLELNDLVAMLLNRPETPLFLCRKLYRWFVNPIITPDVETNVITPLAALLASPANNWNIRPVVEKLLTSQVFFDLANRGAIVKSSAELMLGILRWFGVVPRDMVTQPAAFRKYMDFVYLRLRDLQQPILDQLTVFGYDPYYQPGLSKLWINTNTIVLRGEFIDYLVQGWYEVQPGYRLQIPLVEMVEAIQPNFADVPPLPPTTPPTGTPAVTAVQVVDMFLKNLFATDISPEQKDFLIDKILMQELPRLSWEFEWNDYRRAPTDSYRRNIIHWRLQGFMKFLLRMPEYQIM
ncbi:MAG: DUF1800 family protein [Cytophagales bacterium]|nr:MAG: DUF1800 family protein [Cytophagales bacterium]